MTAPRRSWLDTFADPAALSDLFAAARDCMGQVCDHEPAQCDCPENRMTFHEAAQWVEREVVVAQQTGQPIRFERGRRPKGRNHEQLELSIAG